MKSSWYLGLGLSLAVLLTGCSSGGGSGSDDESGEESKTVNPGPALSGSYNGTITEEGAGSGSGILLLSRNPDGNTANFVNRAPGTYATGIIEFEDNNFVGVLEQYRGGRPSTGNFQGNIEGQSYASYFEGESFRMSDGEKESTFAFERQDKVSALGVSLSKIASSDWTDTQTPSVNTTFSISEDGTVGGGGGGASCTFNGTASVPDPSVNVFKIDYVASNCQASSSTDFTPSEQEGSFQGYGFYKPAGNTSEQLVILVDNDKISRYYVLD
ncbi:hypothetical protein [Hydrocarboniclastica marina]|uniref:hypothetical protein n=1 Tax=Hydrocarboniclastica marina TaxID=2259620 RepID=UPI0010A8D65B|nr:hypothetical protein [Hydrocarboniclastica marina]